MASVRTQVQVNITKAALPAGRPGFGKPLLMVNHSVFPEVVREYTSRQGLIDDGFTAGSLAVQMVEALLAQNPAVSSFLIGKRTSAFTLTHTLTVDTATDNIDYAVTVNGTDFSVNSGGGATPTSIAAAIAAAINGGTEPVTATPVAGVVTLTADNTNELYGATADESLMTLINTTADTGIVADVDAVRAVNDTWYMLLLEQNSDAEIAALASTIEATNPDVPGKFFLASTMNNDTLTASASDIMSTQAALNRERTALAYHSDARQFMHIAWAGESLPFDPGSQTWKFKTLGGVAADGLTDGQIANLDTKSGNYYIDISGTSITAEGVTTSGEFIDVTRFLDNSRVDISFDVYDGLRAVRKLPFTQAGIDVVTNLVQGALDRGVIQGGYAPDPAPVASAPALADIPTVDKANRELRNVRFDAVLAGAIHKVFIDGNVSV